MEGNKTENVETKTKLLLLLFIKTDISIRQLVNHHKGAAVNKMSDNKVIKFENDSSCPRD